MPEQEQFLQVLDRDEAERRFRAAISVGAIAADRNNSRACWLWLVADNLRVAAENSVAVAREIL